MKIQWLGTAGFVLASDKNVILIDPYLSRNQEARPVQPLTPQELGADYCRPVSHILISHGHFDHLMDIPEIAEETGAVVCCSPGAAQTLRNAGLKQNQIFVVNTDGWKARAGEFCVQAFYSRHVRFDLKLLARTLVRMGRRLFQIYPLFKQYPCGQVLSWRIEIGGKRIHFFGSAGATAEELSRIRDHGPIDLLLVPLQGHSQICRIGLDMVRQLKPVLVMPHHQDNFYPPLSQAVDIGPFLDGVKHLPGVAVIVPEMNRKIGVWD